MYQFVPPPPYIASHRLFLFDKNAIDVQLRHIGFAGRYHMVPFAIGIIIIGYPRFFDVVRLFGIVPKLPGVLIKNRVERNDR